MPALPASDDPLLVRTDFSSDDGWRALVTRLGQPNEDGFQANLTPVDEPAFADAAPESLAQASDHAVLFVADRTTISHPERPVLCIDPEAVQDSFRAAPAELWGIENNLSLGNMDFGEFAEAVGDDGIFRGFD